MTNSKLKALLTSRKFWATVAAITTAITAALNNAITWAEAVNAIVAALGLYCVGTGLDNPPAQGDNSSNAKSDN